MLSIKKYFVCLVLLLEVPFFGIEILAQQDSTNIVSSSKQGREIKKAFKISPLLLKFKTTGPQEYIGHIKSISSDSITIETANSEVPTRIKSDSITQQLSIANIKEILIVKKSTFYIEAPLGTLIPAALGAGTGVLFTEDSDDAPWVLGLIAGGIGISIHGSRGILRGVDHDVRWTDKSVAERKLILNQLKTRAYHSPFIMNLTPYIGVLFPKDGDATYSGGVRLRTHFNQRSGLEIEYGLSGWYDRSYDQDYINFKKKERFNALHTGFFVSFTRNKRLNPFIGWACGVHWIKKEVQEADSGYPNYQEYTYTDSDMNFILKLHGGVESNLNRSLAIEGRVGFMSNLFEIDKGLYENLFFQIGMRVMLFH